MDSKKLSLLIPKIVHGGYSQGELVEFINLPIAYGYLFGLIFGTGIAAGFAFIPLWLVRKRVERLGEG